MTMGIPKRLIRVTHVGALIFAIAGLSVLALAGTRAAAQETPYIDTSHPNIKVDLTVLEDKGYTPASSVLSPLAGGYLLLMPGTKFPVSQLHVPPPAGSVQSMPFTAETGSQLHAPSPTETATVPPPATAPEKPLVFAAEEPPPLTPPPPPVEETQPAPPPAPETVAVAKMEPEAPPPPAADKVEVPKAIPAAAEPEPKATEQASLPAADAALKPGQVMEVVFPPSASKLPAAAKKALKSLAAKLKGEDGLRLRLMAYAGGKALSASKARRLSLSRALAVRSYLIESGVRSTRIDVRALGDKTDKTSGKPANRVDINVVER